MLIGYGIGAGTGIVVGGLLAEFRPLERTVFPYIVAVQSVPKIALAPSSSCGWVTVSIPKSSWSR